MQYVDHIPADWLDRKPLAEFMPGSLVYLSLPSIRPGDWEFGGPAGPVEDHVAVLVIVSTNGQNRKGLLLLTGRAGQIITDQDFIDLQHDKLVGYAPPSDRRPYAEVLACSPPSKPRLAARAPIGALGLGEALFIAGALAESDLPTAVNLAAYAGTAGTSPVSPHVWTTWRLVWPLKGEHALAIPVQARSAQEVFEIPEPPADLETPRYSGF